MSETAELLIRNVTVYTQNESRQVLKNADVAIRNGRIAAVGPGLSGQWTGQTVIDGTGKSLFPGMHNTHVHIFQSLLKGLGADLNLVDWLAAAPSRCGPTMTPEMYALACQIAAMESLKCGVTTLADFNYLQQSTEFAHRSIATLEEIGIRGIYMDCYHDTGLEVGVNPSYIHPAAECIRRTDALVRQYHTPEHPLTSVWAGASWIPGATRDLLIEMAQYSQETGIPYTMHILETEIDNEYAWKYYGMSLVDALERYGVLSDRLLAVHCVRLRPEEIDRFAQYGVNAAYCPMANTYLGSGIPPMAQMLRAGVNITMATDGAASNNSSDMLETLKMGLLLQKGANCDPTAMRAQDMLDFVTRNAAQAEGRTDLGVIEPGKQADLFLFNPYYVRSAPNLDSLTTLMYSAGQENIETTIVAGKIVYDKGQFACGLEEQAVAAQAEEVMARFLRTV